jgi:hypothetical protein
MGCRCGRVLGAQGFPRSSRHCSEIEWVNSATGRPSGAVADGAIFIGVALRFQLLRGQLPGARKTGSTAWRSEVWSPTPNAFRLTELLARISTPVSTERHQRKTLPGPAGGQYADRRRASNRRRAGVVCAPGGVLIDRCINNAMISAKKGEARTLRYSREVLRSTCGYGRWSR